MFSPRPLYGFFCCAHSNLQNFTLASVNVEMKADIFKNIFHAFVVNVVDIIGEEFLQQVSQQENSLKNILKTFLILKQF